MYFHTAVSFLNVNCFLLEYVESQECIYCLSRGAKHQKHFNGDYKIIRIAFITVLSVLFFVQVSNLVNYASFIFIGIKPFNCETNKYEYMTLTYLIEHGRVSSICISINFIIELLDLENGSTESIKRF